MHRALVVDDEPQVRELTSRALARYRFQCDQACDGEEALEACNRVAYDAVVTDLRMPRRHGHSLAVELNLVRACRFGSGHGDRLARSHVKSRTMPGTNDFASFQIAVTKRAAIVSAHVVGAVKLAIDIENDGQSVF